MGLSSGAVCEVVPITVLPVAPVILAGAYWHCTYPEGPSLQYMCMKNIIQNNVVCTFSVFSRPVDTGVQYTAVWAFQQETRIQCELALELTPLHSSLSFPYSLLHLSPEITCFLRALSDGHNQHCGHHTISPSSLVLNIVVQVHLAVTSRLPQLIDRVLSGH